MSKRLLLLIPLLVFLFGVSAFGQTPLTTTIADTVYQLNGSPQTGTLTITNPPFISPDGYAISASQTVVTLASNGTFSVNLVPTFGGQPAGTYYTVQITPTVGIARFEQWSVPYFATPLLVSQVIVTGPASPLLPLAGDAVGPYLTNQVTQLHFGTHAVPLGTAAPITGDCEGWNGTTASFTFACSSAPVAPGGINGQLQYNSSGGFGGFTVAGDCGLIVPNITCTKTNGVPFAPSATIDATNAGNISSGVLAAARLPNPSPSSLGGIQSYAAVLHQWINQISTFGVVSSSQPACADLSNSAPSCSVDATNASNITSGTLATAREPSTTVNSVINDTNVSGSILNQVLTLGWMGTLAAGRLNANVVQAITNDTNITGSITAQNLTLGWTGTLAAGRLNSSVVQGVTNDTNITGAISNQNLTLGFTGTLSAARLNSNVVQSFVNDTNITASILNQVATLGWTGTLAAGRLNSNVVQAITNDTNVTGSITAQNLTLGWTGAAAVPRGGSGAGTFTAHGVLLGEGTSPFVSSAPTANAQCYMSAPTNFATTDPSFQTCPSGSGSGNVNNAAQFDLPYYSAAGTTNILSGAAPTSSPNGVPCVWYTLFSAGSPTAPTCNIQGVPVNASLGSSPYTNAVTDRGSLILGNPSSAFTINLPNPTTSGFGNNFVEAFRNYGTAAHVLTPPSGVNLNGANAALNLSPNWTGFLWSDNTNLWLSRLPDFGAFVDCHAGNQAEIFTASTGAFGCNTISGTGGGQVNYPITSPVRTEQVGLSLTSSITVANTVTATSIIGPTFAGRNYIPPGAMLPNGGGAKTVNVFAVGVLGTAGSLPTLTVKVLLGGITLSTINVPLLTSLSNDAWELEYAITMNGIGSANVGGCVHVIGTSSAELIGCASSPNVTGLSFATLQNIDIQATWGTADPANTFTVNQLSVYAGHTL